MIKIGEGDFPKSDGDVFYASEVNKMVGLGWTTTLDIDCEGEFPKADGDLIYASEINEMTRDNFKKTTLGYANVSVATSSTAIVAAGATRRGLTIYNNGTQTLFLGPTGVTTTTGFPLLAGESYYFKWSSDAVYGVCASGTCDTRYLEVK